jgi:hypothetical protein
MTCEQVHCRDARSTSGWRRQTKTHSHNNRRHLERDCHRSATTQLWNTDMPTSSHHTEVSVHCCQGKHKVASSRTLLSDLVLKRDRGCNSSRYPGIISRKYLASSVVKSLWYSQDRDVIMRKNFTPSFICCISWVYFTIHLIICYWLVSSFKCTIFIIIIALQPFAAPWPLFQFLDPMHRR